MKENRVKRILREGGLALGTHVGGIADPQVVELIGLAGFDAAFIDMEHTTFDLHDVQLAVMAAERVGITPIVRTPGFDPAFILRLLDMGVQGIQVPHVGDAATARTAVKAVRYPPLGDRGMAAGSRAAEFGKVPLVEHMAQSNREILLACMIEDMAAVERIDEIAAVDGVDLLAVGPSDLSRSLGVSGQPDHPRLVAAIDRVREAVKKGTGVRLALPLNHAALPRDAAQLKALGAGYTNCHRALRRVCCGPSRTRPPNSAGSLASTLSRDPRQTGHPVAQSPPGEAACCTREPAARGEADGLEHHGDHVSNMVLLVQR
jgi:2-keto-3-deoxy-L-rhamnonate aldolase RhmA